MCISGGTTRARVAAGVPSWRRFVYLEIIPSGNIQILGRYCVGKSCRSILMLIAVTRRSKKKDRKKDGVEKKEMTFRQVTKEEKGPNIAVRSPIAEKRRRESEEK
jgi:hypothetical protein